MLVCQAAQTPNTLRHKMFPGGANMFGMMDQMMNDMMRMNQGFIFDPFFHGPALAQQQRQAPRANTYVEEVPADAHHQHRAEQGSGPIVEEPDEDSDGEGHHAEPPSYHQPQQQQQYAQHRAAQPQPPANNMLGMPLMSPFGGLFDSMFSGMGSGMGMNMQSGGGGGGQVYSYSSSTTYSSGPGGVYQSSSTTRQGPGGVRESQNTVRDGRTGHESMTIARGIGSKERVVSRTRDATGQLHTTERNQGIDPTNAHNFDQEWVQHAQQTLPNWTNPGAQQQQRLGQGRQRQQQQQLALPPAGGVQYQQQQQQGGAYGHQQYAQQQRGVGGQYGGAGGGWTGGYHA